MILAIPAVVLGVIAIICLGFGWYVAELEIDFLEEELERERAINKEVDLAAFELEEATRGRAVRH